MGPAAVDKATATSGSGWIRWGDGRTGIGALRAVLVVARDGCTESPAVLGVGRGDVDHERPVAQGEDEQQMVHDLVPLFLFSIFRRARARSQGPGQAPRRLSDSLSTSCGAKLLDT